MYISSAITSRRRALVAKTYPSARRGTVILWGQLAALPVGGLVWQVWHYLVPLRRLGFDVWYVEDSDRALYELETFGPTLDPEAYRANIERLAQAMTTVGLGDRWAFREPTTETVIGATDASGLDRLYAEAVCAFNLCGAQEIGERQRAVANRVYLETDPVRMQIGVAQGSADAIETLDRYDWHFTYGRAFGAPGCRVPLMRYDWNLTVPPVCPEFWRSTEPLAADAPLTTVCNWKHSGNDVTWQGETWRWTKDREFNRVLDLPGRSALPLEICLGGASEDERAGIAARGWTLKRAGDYTEPDDYRRYIMASRGEFSAAKEQVVVSRSGWISDRTVCYLAAGRPAIVQDTGIGAVLPVGEGLVTFRTAEEALVAIEDVAANYELHAQAARALVDRYFDADRVVGDMVAAIGLA
ncbi:MAG: glycosyltransferase family 1 protein [Alphaproteobacteria bacterium]|nr:glycosyltransferase family 1 protein [Alphaproteobacteria bacterium]